MGKVRACTRPSELRCCAALCRQGQGRPPGHSHVALHDLDAAALPRRRQQAGGLDAVAHQRAHRDALWVAVRGEGVLAACGQAAREPRRSRQPEAAARRQERAMQS